MQVSSIIEMCDVWQQQNMFFALGCKEMQEIAAKVAATGHK